MFELLAVFLVAGSLLLGVWLGELVLLNLTPDAAVLPASFLRPPVVERKGLPSQEEGVLIEIRAQGLNGGRHRDALLPHAEQPLRCRWCSVGHALSFLVG